LDRLLHAICPVGHRTPLTWHARYMIEDENSRSRPTGKVRILFLTAVSRVAQALRVFAPS